MADMPVVLFESRPLDPNLCSQNGIENLDQKIKNMIRPENISPEFLCPEKPEPRILFAQMKPEFFFQWEDY
jgi:hypothetical protein